MRVQFWGTRGSIAKPGPSTARYGGNTSCIEARSARRNACHCMRLHEEFGISVSDDTVYRALKELGFSHVSARPKAYKQDPEAMEAFKKTFPPAWPRSALSLRLAHR